MKNYKALMTLSFFSFLLASLTVSAQPNLTPSFGQPGKQHEIKINKKITPNSFKTMEIEEVIITNHGSSMSWSVKTYNKGNQISKGQLEITTYQTLGNRILGKAGRPILWNRVIRKGDRNTFTRQNWKKLSQAAQLKVVIKNKQTHQTVSKLVDLPRSSNNNTATNSPAANVINSGNSEQFTNPKQQLSVVESKYLGRGRYSIKLKNEGNRNVVRDQLTFKPFYFVKNRPPVVGNITTNPSTISTKNPKKVYGGGGGIYINNDSECFYLEKVVVEIKNPTTNQILEHTITVPKPEAEVVNIEMYWSQFSYTVTNTGPYQAKFDLKVNSFPIYRGDVYSPKKEIAVLKDLFYKTVTLKANETKTVRISPEDVNRIIKHKVSKKLDKPFYGADLFSAQVFLKNDSNYCSGKEKTIHYPPQFRIYNGPAAGEEILMSD